MRILVCGSRTWEDSDTIERVLLAFSDALPIIIHGAARGADHLADWVAADHGWTRIPFPVTDADWRKHGKAAGAIRNRQMLEEGQPDLVIAFRVRGESRGTDNMIAQARKEGVPVWVVREGEL